MKVSLVVLGVIFLLANFQIIPPILALVIGLSVYWFTLSWTKSSRRAWWSVFFVYFGGSWGWLVNLIRGGNIDGESMFWSQQSISTLINPPFALSLLVIFAGLYYLNKGLRTKNKKLLIIATFLFGILVQIKVYAGILVLIGLFVAGIWRMFKRKGISLIKVFAGVSVISVLIFSPLSNDVGNSVIFKPFWFLETMMQFPDRLGWTRFGEAMVNYKLAGNWLKGIPAYFVSFAIFWFGNLGTRVFKEPLFFKHMRRIKKLSYLDVFCYSIIGLGAILPIFFVQSGTAWNTIQFLYYSLMFAGILAGIAVGRFVEKSKLNTSMIYIIEVAIILLTIPTTIGTLWYHYLPSRPPARISNEELEALEFLSKQPDGVVLTQPFSKEAAQAAVNNPPRPLYLYESTAYVSAFSGKPVFLEDEVNLEITGYDWKNRRQKAEVFLQKPNVVFLSKNKIKYIYIVKDNHPDNVINMEKIFENDEIEIHKIY